MDGEFAVVVVIVLFRRQHPLDAFYALGRKPHCKALLRTMGNVMSRRVKSQ